MRSLSFLALLATLAGACIDADTAAEAIEAVQSDGVTPDSMPVMLNRELPFRYPLALYEAGVQGNVTLRIHIDGRGQVWPESTQVIESSGYPGLDSAAVTGAGELHFRPALQDGRPMPVSLFLPVYFRHPRGKPLPGDTILRQQPSPPTTTP